MPAHPERASAIAAVVEAQAGVGANETGAEAKEEAGIQVGIEVGVMIGTEIENDAPFRASTILMKDGVARESGTRAKAKNEILNPRIWGIHDINIAITKDGTGTPGTTEGIVVAAAAAVVVAIAASTIRPAVDLFQHTASKMDAHMYAVFP